MSDRKKEYMREWQAKNSEARQEYMRKWREANRNHLARYQAERRKKNPEESRDINRRSASKRKKRDPEAENKRFRDWKRKNPQKMREYLQRHGERHPLKALARQMVQTSVRYGLLEKPTRCERCEKSVEKKALHGHHEDYGKPLEVQWLCRGCHHAVHREIEQQLAMQVGTVDPM